jgi:drug/metabolite transporter (DMT)-like permease
VLATPAGDVKPTRSADGFPLALLPSWLWIVFTLVASSAQTARNAMQRDLVASVGTQGATYVRFLFGFPFVVVFLLVLRVVTGEPFPVPDLRAIGWAFGGASSQVAATAFMLMAMRDRSFLVTIAYTKTEAILVALFSIVFLGEHPTPMVAVAILLATTGVLLMSWPRGLDAGGEKQSWRPAVIGLASGACFGLSATSYRGAVLALQSKSFIMTATMTLFIGLVIQCVLIVGWLLIRDRDLLGKILKNWRPSLLAGMMGALASEFWFLAFAISSATKVRTLALVEVPMAHVVSRRVFKQGMSRADIAGTALIVAGVILLING